MPNRQFQPLASNPLPAPPRPFIYRSAEPFPHFTHALRRRTDRTDATLTAQAYPCEIPAPPRLAILAIQLLD